jgi:hypothetical protein
MSSGFGYLLGSLLVILFLELNKWWKISDTVVFQWDVTKD